MKKDKIILALMFLWQHESRTAKTYIQYAEMVEKVKELCKDIEKMDPVMRQHFEKYIKEMEEC